MEHYIYFKAELSLFFGYLNCMCILESCCNDACALISQPPPCVPFMYSDFITKTELYEGFIILKRSIIMLGILKGALVKFLRVTKREIFASTLNCVNTALSQSASRT